MDINTPRGQATLKQEQRAVAIFNQHFPRFKYTKTPKAAVIDALLFRENAIWSAVQTKCRNLYLETLRGEYRNEWLVMASKLEIAAARAKRLCVRLCAFIYLVPDDVLLIQPLFDPKAGWLTKFEQRETETQKTVNGGTIVRPNAYVDVSAAKEYRAPKDKT